MQKYLIHQNVYPPDYRHYKNMSFKISLSLSDQHKFNQFIFFIRV